MRIILHIFKKDARHLWPHALAFAALLAALACSDILYALRVDAFTASDMFYYGPLAFVALPLACWNLVVAVIHGESPVGDRQYWISRPFDWRHLVAAKVLFLAVFINLPVFLCQSAIVARAGISPLSALPALLWRQVFFTALMVLPAAALGAVTTTLAQALFVGLLILLPAGLISAAAAWTGSIVPWESTAWINRAGAALLTAAGCAAIVILQYRRRRTAISRGLMAAVAAAAVAIAELPLPAGAFVFQKMASTRPSAAAKVRMSLAGDPNTPPGGSRTDFLIPIRFEGIPPELEIYADRSRVVIDVPQFEYPKSPALPPASWWSSIRTLEVDSRIEAGSDGQWRLRLSMDRGLVEKIGVHGGKVNAMRIRGSADLALFAKEPGRLMTGGAPVALAGFGICMSRPVECFTPFPARSLDIEGQREMSLHDGQAAAEHSLGAETPDAASVVSRSDAFAPFPTSVSFVPLERVQPPPLARFANGVYIVDSTSTLELAARRPVVFFRCDFDFRDVRLPWPLSPMRPAEQRSVPLAGPRQLHQSGEANLRFH